MQPRNPHSLTVATLAAIALARCAIGAGWSDVWPAQEHSRETVRQLSECYTGVYERCNVLGVTLPATPTWYRSNRGTLLNLKSTLRNSIDDGNWLNTNETANTLSGEYLNAHLGADFPLFGVADFSCATNLCRILRIPTNYFAYTPYRCLAGLGPYTNDTSVAYPHGYTNASTQAGGTNYPAGRTVWYTTDYGWNQIPTILAALTHTRMSCGVYDTNYFRGFTTPTSNTWDTAKAGAEAAYAGVSSFGYDIWYGAQGTAGEYGDPNKYQGWLQMSRHYLEAGESFATAYASHGDYFVYAAPRATDGVITQSVFDAHGTALLETQYVAIASDLTNTWGNGVSFAWGATNIPTWCAEPYSTGPNKGNFRGHVFSDTYVPRTYRRWTVPGGFTFY